MTAGEPNAASASRAWPGLDWREEGQAVLFGPPLAASDRLDRVFAGWAEEMGAEDYRFPTFLAARDLQRLDYFRSFPHLVTFAVALDDRPEALRAFAATDMVDATGAVRLGALAPVREVLTPAACYHVYALLQEQELKTERLFTTVATCFRREAWYRPLERQWNFSMREIVCLGTLAETRAFLASFRERTARFFAALPLPVTFEIATDPFFDPARNPKFLAQMVDPVKTELLFGGLAIGSLNAHRNFFGETFGIHRDGEGVFSACVAFGLERCLFALLTTFGPDPEAWPAAVGGRG